MFPSPFHDRPHISTRQYGRLVRNWVASIGVEPSAHGTHPMRRTKAAEIYRKTDNRRAVQLLLDHTKVDSTVRYLGVELEDALSIVDANRYLLKLANGNTSFAIFLTDTIVHLRSQWDLTGTAQETSCLERGLKDSANRSVPQWSYGDQTASS